MKKDTTIIYYNDLLTDDYFKNDKNNVIIDKNFKYVNDGVIWKIKSFFAYDVLMKPVAKLYLKIKFKHKIVNAKVLKNYKKSGYFLYGNHALTIGDAFVPNVVNSQKTYVVINSDNFKGKAFNNFLMMNGALPLPTKPDGVRNFLAAMEKRIKQNKVVTIYPEAHVWPYYTKIRPYKSSAFKYPVKFNAPVFSITNVFKKNGNKKTPIVITYVDGPFFADATIPQKLAEERLRNDVYNAMTKRAKNSNYEYIIYKPIPKRNKETTDD